MSEYLSESIIITLAEGAELKFRHCVFFFFVSFVFVGVTLKYASLVRMRFGPGHVSRPFASMTEWLARRTLRFDSQWTHIELFFFFSFFSS